MYKRFILYLFLINSLLCWHISSCSAQKLEADSISIVFYNLENLFDTDNDSTKLDDEYAYGGIRNWNYNKFKHKINQIARVIVNIDGYEMPDIVAVCEVENYNVLEKLCDQSLLKNSNYRIIHKDSPDTRGIDVALLYRTNKVQALTYKYHPIIDRGGNILSTREILEATFKVGNDTLNIFVNHWTSRYGGQSSSLKKRQLAAETLIKHIKQLRHKQAQAKIVVVGDFNDEPNDKSMKWLCKNEHQLINLSSYWSPQAGTLKHQANWSIFDQIIVSPSLLLSPNRLACSVNDAKIISFPFLLKEDEKWGGLMLYRTYFGYKYQGGYSDHLPVKLKLRYN